MHEYSIVQALIERAEAEANARGARAIHRLRVRIGELSGVEIELLRTAYDTFRERTLCRAAQLDVEPVAARWVCCHCQTSLSRGAPLRCAACGGPGRLAEGDEIILERIEMEVE